MTKRELVWLITRLIGLLLLYFALGSAMNLVAGFSILSSTPSSKAANETDKNITTSEPQVGYDAAPYPYGTPATKPSPQSAKQEATDAVTTAFLKVFFWNFFLTAIYASIGFYLIRDGRFLFQLLNKEDEPDDSGKPQSIGILDQ